MFEKPDISEVLIISCLQEDYGLQVAQLTFLPLGADQGTAVYRAVTDDGTAYFLKLRKGFDEITVTVPLFLKAQGIQAIIAPLETKSGARWSDIGDFKIILFPFIEGRDGFDMELSDHHRQGLGLALKRIHTAQVPPELKNVIPQESFSPQWREGVKNFQRQVENNTFDDSTASRLAEFMQLKRNEISHLVERAERFASGLQSQPLEFVLCHSDIHGGNILISDSDELYIVDWDNPILAPQERDLMFVGGGIDEIWKSEQEIAVFYEGYGRTDINLSALAYYRYERIVEDLAVICEQLLSTDEGGADRAQAYKWFTSNFEPGNTIEIAYETEKRLS